MSAPDVPDETHPGCGSETPRWPRGPYYGIARRVTDLSTALVTGKFSLGAVTLTFGANIEGYSAVAWKCTSDYG
jgi:hypothetical protein